MSIPKDCRYTKEHEWARAEGGGKYAVGITDYAQTELGDVVFLELPEIGRSVKKGESFGTVESTKAVSEIYAPISGKVVDVNTALAETPEKINSSPHEEAWMIRIEVSNESEAAQLMDSTQYSTYLSEISK